MDVTSEHSNIESLLNWLQSFNFSQLHNEDDVETKFVIKFLEYLGYTDQHRCGKYPVKAYQPGKRGRNPEIDNIYFSTDDTEKQGPDTSLLLVEAKSPNETSLEKGIAQAAFYGNEVKVLLYLVTNGLRLKVFKRHRHHDDECIFDAPTSELLNKATLTWLYNHLRFDVIKSIKESAVNDLTHDLYVEVSQALYRNPDLRAQLAKGDFNTDSVHEEGRIVISQPGVAVDCQLPLVYRGGNCKIEFSNVLLRGLTCQLTHNDILRDLLIGLHTPPEWEVRCFLKKTENGTFEAKLGQTTVLLSEREAQDLCTCVDRVGQVYKEALIEATDLLEAWDYPYVQAFDIPGLPDIIQGFSLLSVAPWLWQLMKRFAYEFDFVDKESNWHIFDAGNHLIRVYQNSRDHANVTLWALFNNSSLEHPCVDILYYDPDVECGFYEDASKKSWRQSVGVQGIWTVHYTHNWILKKFIPKVLSHYHVQYHSYQDSIHVVQNSVPHFPDYKISQQQQQKAIIKKAASSNSEPIRPLLSHASELKHLAPYLHAVQEWLYHHYGLAYQTQKIAASLLRPYYATFTKLFQAVDPMTVVDTGLIAGVERRMRKERQGEISTEEAEVKYEDLLTREGIVEYVNKHVNRIYEIEVEFTYVAEYISRMFISISKNGQGYIEQDLFNEAKQVIFSLWQQSRFEERFIAPLPE